MRKLFLVLSIFCLLASFSFAQEVSSSTRSIRYYNNISASVGYGSFAQIIGSFSHSLSGLGYSEEYYRDDTPHYIPSINIGYGRQLSPLINLGATISYSQFTSDVRYRSNDEKAWCSLLGTATFIPYVRFDWLRRDIVRCYSSVGVGVCNYIDKNIYSDKERDVADNSVVFIGFDVVPIGVAVGRSLYGLAEVSIGTNGFLKVGAGYRF